MIDTLIKKACFAKRKRSEINWAKYLDYTLFLEEDVENEQLDKFVNDLL